MACKATSGLTNSCTDLLRVGGAGKDWWFGYLSELDTQFSLAQSADISSFDFGSYGGLRKVEGQKFQHTFGSELVVNGSGNKSYKHSAVVKALADSTADDLTLQNLNLGTDIFIVYEDNNQQFFILGAGNGLTAVSDVQNTGQTGDSDTADTITLEGQERQKPLRFTLPGGYTSTKSYIQSFQL
jgi:hypothetical protein